MGRRGGRQGRPSGKTKPNQVVDTNESSGNITKLELIRQLRNRLTEEFFNKKKLWALISDKCDKLDEKFIKKL